ncbi:putative hydrolase of the HAD superfamily [Goodfellowiella coeruleoviolacea]|uniref:Hydrolase of the HAD superfamily n=1 Tax=Goodfellowiella coeruleoviolacea TaxID=334858 RepID=A0AAE3GG95_9PSEU|nr:putative hydrolase of the HAD superfamily [Goodfellowiella coeruleoviolacea]
MVFDFGGVLTTTVTEFIAHWIHTDDIDHDHYRTVMRSWLGRDAAEGNPLHQLEIGALPVAEFERALAARLRTRDGRPVPAAGLVSRMFAAAVPDPAMIDLVDAVRAAGLHVGLLSNSWGESYPEDLLARLCDTVVISGRVGLRKPDPRIYHHLLDRLGLPAQRCVFVDDAPPNVAAAHAVGMHAIHHTSAATTRAALAQFVPHLSEVAP